MIATARDELHRECLNYLDAETFDRWALAWARDHGPRERTEDELRRSPGWEWVDPINGMRHVFPGARPPTRGDLVDLASRQFESWTVRQVALLSIVAGFPPPARVGMTVAEVIAREVKTIRIELARQIEDGNASGVPVQGERGRPRKKAPR